jgi:hypothetical protein
MRARSFPYSVLVGMILAIAVVNAAALYWHLYFYLRWFDIPMHFIGGLWTALFALSMYYRLPLARHDWSPWFIGALGVASTMIVGLGWELFEFNLDTIVGFSDRNHGDTLADLVMDLLGAIIAATVFIRGGYYRKTQ